jgi:hypothetical protein
MKFLASHMVEYTIKPLMRNKKVQLIRKTHLDRTLIGCSCVLQPEGHCFVGVIPYGVMKAVLIWSSSLSAI